MQCQYLQILQKFYLHLKQCEIQMQFFKNPGYFKFRALRNYKVLKILISELGLENA